MFRICSRICIRSEKVGENAQALRNFRGIIRVRQLGVKTVAKSELFRELPSVDEVLRMPCIEALPAAHGIAPVTAAVRAALASLREEIASGLLDGSGLNLALTGLGGAIEEHLRRAL